MRTTMHASRPFSTVFLRRRLYAHIVASATPPLTGATRVTFAGDIRRTFAGDTRVVA